MSTKITKITRNKEVDLARYINMDTGEDLSSELRGGTTIKEETGYVLLSSDDYAVVDSKAVAYLAEKLNRSDLGSCLMMAEDLKTAMNIVYNNNIPHTNKTLQQHLKIASQSTFTLLIKRLMNLGVLYQIKGKIMGEIRVIYMMNPYLVRKRKALDEKVTDLFERLEIKKIV